MIPVKVLASVLLLLTFIHAFPLTLELVDNSSIQRGNLVVRQTTPPVSVAATRPGSLNLTGLVDTFEGLVVDLQGVEGVLQNLTETLGTNVSQVALGDLADLTRNLTIVLEKIEDMTSKLRLPNGPIKDSVDAIHERLNSLIGSLDDLMEALSEFSGDLNSAVEGTIQTVFNVASSLIKSVLRSLGLFPPNKDLNDFPGLSDDLTVLRGALDVVGVGIGL